MNVVFYTYEKIDTLVIAYSDGAKFFCANNII